MHRLLLQDQFRADRDQQDNAPTVAGHTRPDVAELVKEALQWDAAFVVEFARTLERRRRAKQVRTPYADITRA